jgi:hypothetical protein
LAQGQSTDPALLANLARAPQDRQPATGGQSVSQSLWF